MGKIGKILATLVTIFLVVIVGLVILVHLYVTEDRVRTLVIPPAEKALQRKVTLGSVKVSLFGGATLHDLSIKEKDGTHDFVRMDGFALRYSLLPLLKKKLVITRIKLLSPYVQIFRDASGHFNYETLGVLQKKAPKEKKEGGGLPLPVTVKEIRVNKAHLVFKDASGTLPNADTLTNMKLSISLGTNPPSFHYRGVTDFSTKVAYGQLKSLLKGKVDFDKERVGYNLNVEAEEEKIQFSGEAVDYSKAPKVTLNITSDKLNVDRLLALKEKLPKRQGSTQKPSGAKGEPPVPPQMEASGKIQIGKMTYKGLSTKDVSLTYSLKKGALSIQDLMAQVAQGEVKGNFTADLSKPQPPHQGDFSLKGIAIEPLLAALFPKGQGVLTGTLQAYMTSQGKGFQWEVLRKNLTASGDYTLENGRFMDFTPVNALATLLNLDELKKLTFQEMGGNFRINKGKILLKSSMKGDDVKARSQGQVGLDGSLNLPIMLQLSPKLSEKLRSRVKFARYLETKEGWTIVPLKLTGTLSRPLPILDTSSVKEGLEKSLKDEASKGLEKLLSGQKKKEEDSKSQPPEEKNPLKKLFGR